jgi:hypothetical protein
VTDGQLQLRPDPGCLRGLRFWVSLPEPIPSQAQLLASLITAFPEAVVGVEHWAAQRIDRLIVQFRVELRLGERAGELGVMFRSCCQAAERDRMRARLLACLAATQPLV